MGIRLVPRNYGLPLRFTCQTSIFDSRTQKENRLNMTPLERAGETTRTGDVIAFEDRKLKHLLHPYSILHYSAFTEAPSPMILCVQIILL